MKVLEQDLPGDYYTLWMFDRIGWWGYTAIPAELVIARECEGQCGESILPLNWEAI